MEVLYGCPELRASEKHFVALGTFDGVHIGHEKIMRAMVYEAHRARGKSIVYTFSNHPRNFLKPERPIKLLTSQESKTRLIENLGVDILVYHEFDERLAHMEPLPFVRDILVACFRPHKVFVGYNYTFGFKGKGTPEVLEELGREFGFTVEIMPPVCFNQDPVSSSRIRKLLEAGEIEAAAKYLGRLPEIRGQVIPGNGIGRRMGFPTANLLISEEMLLPFPGVYFGLVMIQDPREEKPYEAVINIGSRPTVGGTNLSFEVHLLRFDRDLYGKSLTVVFRKRLRDEIKFHGLEELKQQIAKDIAMVSAK